MNKESKVYIAGHTGLVGSSIVRKLKSEGYENLLTVPSADLDLRKQADVELYFKIHKPEYVFLCAGIVGGILANSTRRGEFIYDNTMIQTNIINAAWTYGVKKLLALGSSCIYPKDSDQPISEDALLSGKLEPTNEPYAVSKISALKMCEAYQHQYKCNFISAMPTNLYGPGDNYDPQNSHVLPALLRKFFVARERNEDVIIWGTGRPRREFMYVGDMAEAAFFLMNNYNDSGHINVGTGEDIEINKVAELIGELLEFKGQITNDTTQPDGMMKKRLDVSKIKALGWSATYSLRDGLSETIKYITQHKIYEQWT